VSACHSGIIAGKEMLKGISLSPSSSCLMLLFFQTFVSYLKNHFFWSFDKVFPEFYHFSFCIHRDSHKSSFPKSKNKNELPTYLVHVIRTAVIFHVLVCSCMKSFQKVKREHGVLRQKLEAYFQVTISKKKSHPLFCNLCYGVVKDLKF
jgi:hypothetical protein